LIDPTTEPVRKSWRHRRKAAALLAIVAATAAVLATTGRQPPLPKLPDPNGYDDIVKAGSLVKGTWPNKGDFAKAAVSDVRAFVEANKATLDLARVGLGRECVVPLENSQEGMERHFEALSPIRAVGRLLQGEALVAQADGRIADASKAYHDELALGQAVTQGGMGVDHSIGSVIQWQAIVGLRKLRDRLPVEEIPAILRELEAADRKRVPLEAVEARWLAWYQGAHNPLTRTMFRLSGIEKKGRADELGVVRKGRDRVERDLRFLLAELAIHAYHQDKGTWPRSLNDLVPAYVSAVPIDPGTGKPLDYPANAEGELTDDLASIARPDGEVAPPPRP
jgi:hypothetical protein